MVAAHYGQTEILQCLMAAETVQDIVNLSDQHQWTALIHAARNNHLDAVPTRLPLHFTSSSLSLSDMSLQGTYLHAQYDDIIYIYIYVVLTSRSGCCWRPKRKPTARTNMAVRPSCPPQTRATLRYIHSSLSSITSFSLSLSFSCRSSPVCPCDPSLVWYTL